MRILTQVPLNLKAVLSTILFSSSVTGAEHKDIALKQRILGLNSAFSLLSCVILGSNVTSCTLMNES